MPRNHRTLIILPRLGFIRYQGTTALLWSPLAGVLTAQNKETYEELWRLDLCRPGDRIEVSGRNATSVRFRGAGRTNNA